ncbi:fibroblast growth factor 1 [Rhinoderma darwinii]|uniref:fibroblast growth factor 1 n=1 Tax=Rhinoderma darwinii TaxID=43563 RepID=UPI003F664326
MAEGDITTFNPMTEKFDLPMGNYKKPKLLYCSNGGYFLRILPDGEVDGTRDRDDLNMQQGSENLMTLNEECLFLETVEENSYNTYKSKKYAELNWFVGIKKNGTSKCGSRTHYGQKAILFLPLPVSSD